MGVQSSGLVSRLLLKMEISFKKIFIAISKGGIFSQFDVLHPLLVAMWRGEFEEYSGHSRLRLGEKLFNRRMLIGAATRLPGIDHSVLAEAIREEISLRRFYKRVDCSALAQADPSQYEPDFLTNYSGPLVIRRRDFRRWYHRFLRGAYEL